MNFWKLSHTRRSLPYRQLRNSGNEPESQGDGSLPYRQLRNQSLDIWHLSQKFTAVQAA